MFFKKKNAVAVSGLKEETKKTKYDIHGALHVNNKGKLVDHDGNVVTLRGLSSHSLSWYPQYINRDFFEFMKDEWKIDIVRLAMYTEEEDGYCVGDEANKEKLLEVIDRGVKYATEVGLYVIIDWHILLDYNPWMFKDEAVKFWEIVAEKYKSYGNVFYEICNEPNMDCDWRDVKSYAEHPEHLKDMLTKKTCEWSDIKSFAEEIIPVIRKHDPYAVILVGTPVWSQRVDQAAADPITIDKNLMYVLHFYANTHKDELRARLQKAAEEGLPLFVTEFGTCSADGAGKHNPDEAKIWLDLLDKYEISYILWSISNRDETCATFKPTCEKTGKDFTDEDMREPALWFVNELKNGRGKNDKS